MSKKSALIIAGVLAVAGVAGMNMKGDPIATMPQPSVTATVRPTRTPRPTPTPRPTRTPKPTVIKHDYVLNNETKIFHKPDCPAGKRIKWERNRRQEVTTTREKLIAAGYSPCENCNP